jgi:bacterioferritin-associated ferredoxin
LSAFDHVAQNCGVATVTAAQILAGKITQVDFQADGGGAAITASGLTSNANTTTTNAAGQYPTTVNVVGGVEFGATATGTVTGGSGPSSSSSVLIGGFNLTGTTTTNGGVWRVYSGGSQALNGGSGGGYADASPAASPSYEYIYVQPTVYGSSDYSYQGVGATMPTGVTVSAGSNAHLSYSLAVNPEWFSQADVPKFVVLLAGNVPGVSTSTCNPSIAAVVQATASATTAYSTPLSSFTFVAQNCGVASVTAAQILASPITQIDFQADGGGAAITASGLKSNANTTVKNAAGQYPTTINVVAPVQFAP